VIRDSSPRVGAAVRDRVLLLAGAAFLLLAGLGSYPLWDPDEGRHAEIARRLGGDGQWLVPRLYGEPYYDKPTSFYWLLRGSFAILGTSELAARLPSALATLATLWIVHHFAVVRLGRRGAAIAAVIYATSPFAVALGRYCNLDATLTFFVTWASIGWILWLDGARARPPWSAYLAMALGTLVKGPVAVLLPALTAMAVALRRGSPRALLGARPALGGFVIFALTLPWLAGTALAEPDYLRTFFVEHNFRRYLSSEFDHVRDSAYFLWVLPAMLLPWSLLAPAVIGGPRDAGSDRRAAAHTGDFAVWAAVVVVFFSFGRAKLAPYVLPAVPPAALWLGAALAEPGRIRTSRVAGALRIWGCVLLLVPPGVAIWISGAHPHLAGEWVWSLVAIPVALATFAAARWRPRTSAIPVLAFGNAALVAVVYLACAPTVSGVASDRSLADLAARHPEIAATGFRVQPASFSFYSQREVARVDEIDGIRERARGGPLFIVSRPRHARALATAGIAVHEWLDTGRHVLYATVPPPLEATAAECETRRPTWVDGREGSGWAERRCSRSPPRYACGASRSSRSTRRASPARRSSCGRWPTAAASSCLSGTGPRSRRSRPSSTGSGSSHRA
jgi:4-amino-4-deoxy-L-arabinose transferase-like glycosyltransferase